MLRGWSELLALWAGFSLLFTLSFCGWTWMSFGGGPALATLRLFGEVGPLMLAAGLYGGVMAFGLTLDRARP